ncbi:carbohydrate ABC transporter membrane protein 1 (CUT1 family) [Haloactinopolyspora alba]|uniref:Carbohydrate ABC transporter membrane protein 1 (CUT1 family) n=1 Tax=Haloactinopolyspora alba TaxID=648780 RepID=A0A2P8DT72_9ACTN|nr:sugar ABC transporter permease [Haloactinopolyspora alba]PSL00414.1 carbohydrate ABC transporter membrane protein 1 (CUT1 family) [Haloactinopolyspora alba]
MTSTIDAGSRPGPGRRTARRRRAGLGDALTGYAFVTPQLLGSAFFVIGPLIAVVWYSLHDWNVLAGTFTFSGAENYERLLSDPSFVDSLQATGIFSAGLVVLNVSLALALAVMLNQRLPGTTTFRTFFFSPVVVSLVAWTIVWGFLLQADGGINGFLAELGVDGPNWLRREDTAMLSVVIVQVFKNVGLNMVLFLAALQGVPRELREAARVDGANAWRSFWKITMPLISPTILLVSILTIVGSLQVFAQIAVLTQGGPGTSTTVLVYYLYQQAFEFKEFGYASAVSVVLFLIVAVLTLVQWQTRKRWVFHEN